MPWGAIASVAGSLISGSMSSQASSDSSKAMAQASEKAAELQNQQFNQLFAREKENQRIQEQRLKPFADMGYNALTAMQYGMGLGGADYLPQIKENFDSDKFMANLDAVLANAPVAPSATTVPGYTKLSIAEQDRLRDQYTRDKAAYDYAAGLRNSTATSPWEIYQKTLIDKKADFLPQDFWKKTGAEGGQGIQGVQGAQVGGFGDGGRFGFGGYGSLTKKFGLDDFEYDPGYNFRKSEGMKGIQSSAAARGGLQSGAALKALNRWNQDLASSEYQNAYNRYVQDQANVYNRLAGVLGTGQAGTQQIINQGNSATANISQAAQANAAAQGNYLTQAADARASGYVASANAWNKPIANISEGFGTLAQKYF